MKFSKSDKAYFERRNKFAEEIGKPDLYETIDQWPLFVGTGNFARFLAILELFLPTIEVPGDIAEFGVWKGSTSSLIAKTLAVQAPLSPKRIHLFDSFEGLTEFTAEDSDAKALKGMYQGSEELLRKSASVNEIDDYFVFHKGFIEDTLPEFIAKAPQTLFSFVYCDTDLFSSTAVILASMWARLSPNGVMVFDQWNMDEFPGEGTAVNQFIETHRAEITLITPVATRQPTLAIMKRYR